MVRNKKHLNNSFSPPFHRFEFRKIPAPLWCFKGLQGYLCFGSGSHLLLSFFVKTLLFSLLLLLLLLLCLPPLLLCLSFFFFLSLAFLKYVSLRHHRLGFWAQLCHTEEQLERAKELRSCLELTVSLCRDLTAAPHNCCQYQDTYTQFM